MEVEAEGALGLIEEEGTVEGIRAVATTLTTEGVAVAATEGAGTKARISSRKTSLRNRHIRKPCKLCSTRTLRTTSNSSTSRSIINTLLIMGINKTTQATMDIEGAIEGETAVVLEAGTEADEAATLTAT